jgi:hypothetical protein
MEVVLADELPNIVAAAQPGDIDAFTELAHGCLRIPKGGGDRSRGRRPRIGAANDPVSKRSESVCANERTGENSSHAGVNSRPNPAISSAPCGPIASASAPPSSAPNGTTPISTNVVLALTRPINSGGLNAWRSVPAPNEHHRLREADDQ